MISIHCFGKLKDALRRQTWSHQVGIIDLRGVLSYSRISGYVEPPSV